MLSAFVRDHYDELVESCRLRVAKRMAPKATSSELEHGIPMFLRQLEHMLESEQSPPAATAAKHGGELMSHGFTVAQVVHDYGDACQTITELAIELKVPISTQDFRALNKCLDDAIADAVTEYERQHEVEVVSEGERRTERHASERLGILAHELRNVLGSAVLAYDMLRTGSVGMNSSTGAVLGRSIAGLQDIVDRSLTEVRVNMGIEKAERIAVVGFVEDVEVSGVFTAKARGIEFVVDGVAPGLAVVADRQLLLSVISNLLQNAFKFTRPNGRVTLRAFAKADRVLFEVEDQCGGVAVEKLERLFEPFEQHSSDRTGLGLGLAICARAVEALHGRISVANHPGSHCVFTVDLPRTE